MDYNLVKLAHVVSATVLFGTGVGSAFYMLLASLTRDARVAAPVLRWVVIADWLFTATTAVLQPVTGLYLVHRVRLPLDLAWIKWSLVLYALAIACWLPVVWIQLRMRDLAAEAAAAGPALPAWYWGLFRAWVALGSVAFVAFVGIFALMVFKPA